MKQKESLGKGKSLRILWLFCSTVFFLVAISLLFKAYIAVSRSTFDGTNRFTILQTQNPYRMYSFSPQSKSISILDIVNDANKKIALKEQIKIPIDAQIQKNDVQKSIEEEITPDTFLTQLFFNFNTTETDLTLVDIIRLWLFARSVDTTDISRETLILSDETKGASDFDKVAQALFTDAAIVTENQSIQVINATGVSGKGNEFARILTNMGGHVVSVTTGKKEAAKSTVIYYGNPTYTVEKIEKIVGVAGSISNKKSISDIIITLGKDKRGSIL